MKKTIKDQLIPLEELLQLRERGFTNYSPNAEQQREGKVYYFENGQLHYDSRPMYSSSAHEGQILAATRKQADKFILFDDMLEERNNLAERIESLQEIFDNPDQVIAMDHKMQHAVRFQLWAMKDYLYQLDQRIGMMS